MPMIHTGALRPDRLVAGAGTRAGEKAGVVMGAGGVRLGWASGDGNPPAPAPEFWSYWSGPGAVMHTA